MLRKLTKYKWKKIEELTLYIIKLKKELEINNFVDLIYTS